MAVVRSITRMKLLLLLMMIIMIIIMIMVLAIVVRGQFRGGDEVDGV